MDTKIIAVLNQKGGPGKSTISMHIAGTLGLRGFDVLVVDGDKQGTAQRWFASAPEDKPFPATLAGLAEAGQAIHREVKKYAGRYDFIVIDCPPAHDSPVGQSAALIADIAVVPVIPSPPDIWAAMPITKLIQNAQVINDALQAVIVLNQCDDRTTLAKETKELLGEFTIPLSSHHIGSRQQFRHAAMYGTIVHTLGAEARKATEEVDALVDELLERLEERGLAANE